MSRRTMLSVCTIAAAVTIATFAIAQRGRFRRESRPDFYDPRYRDSEVVDRRGVPDWENDARFKDDVFTFARVRYSSYGGGRRWGGGWRTDYPDSDLNFSFRLHQLTALETDPDGKIVELTDDELFDYPFLYLIEPGAMSLSEEEVVALRTYLLNGGFLMVDDFWGEDEWFNFHSEFKRVFPDREPVELPLEHEIFHIVYPLSKKPQVPSIHAWENGQTTERWDAQEPHYKGVFDDKGRMMAIICHNTDLGDGWEQEGASPGYFKEMAEKWSYPLGINIITYEMTH